MRPRDCQFAFVRIDEATGKNVFRCVHCPRVIVTPNVRIFAPCKSESPRVACVHRGEATGLRKCPSCKGSVKVKIFACAIHGECTLAKPLEGVACCGGCKDFTA